MILPSGLHGEANQVAAADFSELQRLGFLLFGFHHKEGDPQQDRPRKPRFGHTFHYIMIKTLFCIRIDLNKDLDPAF